MVVLVDRFGVSQRRACRVVGQHRSTQRLTPDGIRVAVFYTKLHRRLLGPLLDADQPPAPIDVRRALATIDHAISDYITNARLGAAA